MRQEDKQITLSDIDIAMIRLLRQDGRMSNRELARNLGISEVTIRKRLTRLREGGVLKIVPLVEPRQLGYKHDVLISIRIDTKYLHEITQKLIGFPEVRFLAITSGAYDVLCAALFKDTDDLADFLINKLSSFNGVVSTETTFSLRVLKRTYDWFAVVNEPTKTIIGNDELI